jgi:hypothetical protein
MTNINPWETGTWGIHRSLGDEISSLPVMNAEIEQAAIPFGSAAYA